MNRKSWIGIALAAMMVASVPVVAAEAASVAQKMDTERVSLDLKNASAKNLFSLYKDLLGVEVDYQCAQEKQVSVSFENLKVRTSLDAICESADLEWSLTDGAPAVLKIRCAAAAPVSETKRRVIKVVEQGGEPKPGEPQARAEVKVRKTMGAQGQKDVTVSINLKDAELADALKMAARLMDARLLADAIPYAGKTVTIKMDEVPITAFLDAVCKQTGTTWSLKPGDPPTLEVTKAP
jgi:hypothetical protein